MSDNPYDRLTIAEAVRHARDTEETINGLLRQLVERTGMRIEPRVEQPEFGPPSIVLKAVAR